MCTGYPNISLGWRKISYTIIETFMIIPESLSWIIVSSLAMWSTFCLLLAAVDGGLFGSSLSRELTQYRVRVDILHQMLINENCIQPKSFRYRREVLSASDGLHLAVEKKLFNNLSNLLISCRQAKESSAPTTTTSPSTLSSGTSTTLAWTTTPTTSTLSSAST